MSRFRTHSAIVAFSALVPTFAQGCARPHAEQTIRDRLHAQAAAWNRCDLEGFMEGYWKSDQLVFESTSKDGKSWITRGWQPTLDRYKKRYDTPEKIGRLTFSDLKVNMTGSDTAVVNGRYEVMQKDARLTGSFVLDMRRMDGKWYVTRDRTTGD